MKKYAFTWNGVEIHLEAENEAMIQRVHQELAEMLHDKYGFDLYPIPSK